ncbi:hypothetical protein HE1_00032 [Holospora elegans E1]|uniref:Uncharacterized protein n=1 Tax=Holospora elegans E1 TaxID=1427503 RepID=A0A023DWF1_9PROT|nr:hypothetical protein HE1_00032 [Holospora elegans E1]
MNVKIDLKEVLFEEFRGTNVKNLEKISRGVPEKDKLQAFVLYASGLSMNRIAQLFGVGVTEVLKWAGTLGSRLCAKIEPSPKDKGSVMEVDEFGIIKKKKQKIWIFKAWIFKSYDRAGKGLID